MNDTGVIVVSSLCKPRQNVTSKNATPVTSYIHIWLNNAITVFGNAIQTNVQRKFAREGIEVWKVENRPFRAFYPSVRTGSSNTRFFFGSHLPQTFARSKQYLPVIFVRIGFIRQNFHDSWCRKLLAM